MIPSIPPSTTGSSKQRLGGRAKKRQAVVSAVVAGLFLITAVVVVAAVSSGDRAGTLTSGTGIESFDPSNGLTNAEVVLVGAGFTNATDVQFNGISVSTFNVVSDTQISTLVPAGATKGPITVVTPDGTLTSTGDFSPSAPSISSFSPTTAATGTTVTITGQNLGGVSKVRIGGKETPAASVSDTQVTAVVPANAVTGPVAVANDDTNGQSTTNITITSPAITNVSPAAVVASGTLTVTGANLSGITSVTFNGAAGTVVSAASDGSSAVVKAPSIVTAGPLKLTTAGGTVTTDAPVLLAPTMGTGIGPTAAPGTIVALKGKNMSSVTAVGFPGLQPTSNGVTVVSDTQVNALVPFGAQAGQITLVGNATTTSGSFFMPRAVITSAWPNVAPVGGKVTLSGSSMMNITAIWVNNVPWYVFSKLNDSTIVLTVPQGATSGVLSAAVGAPGAIGYYKFTSNQTITIGTASSAPIDTGNPPAGSLPFTPPSDAPVGGTDFARAASVSLAGITVVPTTSGSTGTATTSVSSTTTAPSSTTTAPSTTSAESPTTTPGATTAATIPPTTAAPQPPYAGTATIQFGNSSKLQATVTYQDPANWSITVAPGATLTVPLANSAMSIAGFGGSVSAADGRITWALAGTTGPTDLHAKRFTFSTGAVATITGQCPMKSDKLCAGTGPWLRMESAAGSTGFAATVGDIVPAKTGLAYLAGVNLGSGSLNLDASYPVDNPVTVINGRLRIAFKDDTFASVNDSITVDSGSVNQGLDIVFTGKSRVDVPYLGSFNPPSVTVRYVDGGTLAVFDFPGKRVLHEASLTTAAFLTGHGMTLNARINGETTVLADGAWVFIGSMRLPTYVREAFGSGDEGEVAAIATLNTNGATEIKALFSTPLKMPDINGINTDFEGFSFAIRWNSSNPALKLEIVLGASGTVTFPGGKPMGVALEVGFAFTKSGPEVTASITGSGVDGRVAWPDVLGVKDFDLRTFSLQIGLSKEYPFVSVGLAGTGTLPPKLLEFLGAGNDLPRPATFIVNLSSSSPCLEVEAGTPDDPTPLFKVPKDVGAVEVSYFKVSASARGCTVGVFSVPAGVVIAQKSKVFGAKQDLYAAFNPNPTALPGMTPTPSFFGWAKGDTNGDRGAIKLKYKVSWGAGGTNPLPYFKISGKLGLGNNNEFYIWGGCNLIKGCYGTGMGSIDLGIGVSTKMEVTVTGLGAPISTITASGDLNLFGLKFGLSGEFVSWSGAPLGFDFSATVDLPGKSALVDKLSVRLGLGLKQTDTGWTTQALSALTIEGNTGGLMKVINGAADAFGAPPAPDGGRYKLRAAWSGDLKNIRFGGSSSIDLDSLGTVGARMHFDMCLDPSCFGNIDADFEFDYRTRGKTFTFKVPLNPDWSFNYSGSYSASFSESDSIGDSWGGLKGSISGSISIGLKISSPPLSIKVPLTFNLKATGYVGLGGSWNSLGSLNVYDNGKKFCVKYDSYELCV